MLLRSLQHYHAPLLESRLVLARVPTTTSRIKKFPSPPEYSSRLPKAAETQLQLVLISSRLEDKR